MSYDLFEMSSMSSYTSTKRTRIYYAIQKKYAYVQISFCKARLADFFFIVNKVIIRALNGSEKISFFQFLWRAHTAANVLLRTEAI